MATRKRMLLKFVIVGNSMCGQLPVPFKTTTSLYLLFCFVYSFVCLLGRVGSSLTPLCLLVRRACKTSLMN